VNTFPKLQRAPEIKALQTMFSDSGLNARVGFNLGSLDISFTLTLPTKHSHPLDVLSALYETHPHAQVVWTMLAICPFQVSPIRTSSGFSRPCQDANTCLRLFTTQSSVAICGREFDMERGYLRIVVCPVEDTWDPATGREQFQYSPMYHCISGFDSTLGFFSQGTMELQREQLMEAMLDFFWQNMELVQHYIAVESLHIPLSYSLHQFFTSGIHGQSSTFLPDFSNPFSFYLFGTAGIGKSAFVKAFSAALQATLRYYVDGDKVVQVVKLPLNAFTAGNLRGILRVKGISDMSIERIIEQTLCKGGVVIFHLEENPADPELQEKLYLQTMAMLSHLVARYPEYRANILTVITSNYHPIPVIMDASAMLIMSAPSPDQQFRWCQLKMDQALHSMTSLSIEIDIQVRPPPVHDLRPLEQWWRSLAFTIGSYLERHESHDALRVSVTGETGRYFISVPGQPSWEPEELCSHNSFFYYPANAIQSNSPLDTHELSSSSPIITSLINMGEREFLQPVVIILQGTLESRLRWCQSIDDYMTLRFGERLHKERLELFTEEDKVKVFGEPSEILGGLFRFIDRINNPNACNGATNRFGLIQAHVNETGQFILRELLEPAQSNTHRQVRKSSFHCFCPPP
jgi:hypothetical protein